MKTNLNSVIQQDYWDEHYSQSDLIYDPELVLFKSLFERYLRPGGTCLEIGCYPGRFLIYLGDRFNYTVSGIDATPKTAKIDAHLRAHGVNIGQIYQGDFFSFNPNQVFDVVCSFGFIEHFVNFEEVISRHIRLVKPGGILIISCPNFCGTQYFLHKLVDPALLDLHYLPAMNLRRWKKVLMANRMELLHHSYYRTAGFIFESRRSGFWVLPTIKLIDFITKKIDGHLNLPNPLLSPYMISISRKIE